MDDQAYHRPLDAYEEYIVRKRKAEAPTLGDTKRIPAIREKRSWDLDGVLFLIFFGWIIVLCWLGAWILEKLGASGPSTYVDRLHPDPYWHHYPRRLPAPTGRPLQTS
jgi:hypothetical protein